MATAAAVAAEVCDGLTLSPWQSSPPPSSAHTVVPAAAHAGSSSHTGSGSGSGAAAADDVATPPPAKRQRATPWARGPTASGHGHRMTWSELDDSDDDDVVPATAPVAAKEPVALSSTPELVPSAALDGNKGKLRLAPVVKAAAAVAAAAGEDEGGALCPKCGGCGIECPVDRLLACVPRPGALDDDDPAHYEYYVMWAPTWELYAPALATEAAELLRRRRAELVLRGERSHR